ncbi:MAG: response regulator [Candidatus Thorarchaeota archaeon]|nr:response regulator [Candidatus Thorarchaeota archaeon]
MRMRSKKLLLFLVAIFGLFMGTTLAIVPGITGLSKGFPNAIVLLFFGGITYACSIKIAFIIRTQFEEIRVVPKPDAAVSVIAIDDEADILQLIRMKLSKEGFDVYTASNGDEGIEKVLRDKPDVMIVDILMPGKDGYQVVAEVKARLREDSPVIIMLTSKTEDADMVKGLSMDIDDYITKPFSPRELIERINVALIKSAKENK